MNHSDRPIGRVRFAALLCLVAATMSCATRQAAPPPAEASLQETVAQLRQASNLWDIDAIAEAGRMLEAVAVADDAHAYRKQLWTGTAWFHVALTQRPVKPDTLSRAVQALQAALEYHEDDSDCHAMLAVLYGMSIRDKPWLALQYGRQLQAHRMAARQDWDTNPRVSYLEGVSQLNRADTPDEFARAITSLRHAEGVFDAQDDTSRDALAPDWGRAHTRMFLGEAYLKLHQLAEARQWFAAAIDIAPDLARARRGYEQSAPTGESSADE